MKRFFTFLCAALMTLSVVEAKGLLKESFGQSTETLATNDNISGGSIAGLDWTNVTGSGNIYMNALDLTYTDYKSSTDATGSIEYKATFGKKVAKEFKSANSGSVYAAAIINVTSCGSTGTGRDYLLALCDATSSYVGTASHHFARICVEKADSKFKFGVSKVNENAACLSYTDELAYGQYLVVVEYEFVEGDKNDIARLYVNPTKGDKPAATIECKQSAKNLSEEEVGAGTKDDASHLQAIVLSNTSSSNKWACLIDEIKVVTAWADLWESSEVIGDPEIQVDNSFGFGNVAIGVPVVKGITIKGSNLKGNINVVSNNPTVLTPSASVIAKESAMSSEGFELNMTLTAAAGSGSAKITLSSEGADNQVIDVSWFGMKQVANIAALKANTAGEAVILASKPLIVNKFEYGAYNKLAVTLQDASGAMHFADYNDIATSWKVGDMIADFAGLLFDDPDDFIEDFETGTFSQGSVESSDNELIPLVGNIANIGAYGPALVKLEDVSFDPEVKKFAEGAILVLKDANSIYAQIKAGNTIIGKDVPSKADVTGLVAHPANKDIIQIRSAADVVDKSTTGIEEVRSETTNVVRSEKKIINGQLVIVKDGKMFNVIGVEL